ncbi:MAG: AzlC family ABC transporter permease [Alphaproteobacteria bacterium]|nr:AzlC family ABC transporter permease [Alphaproteobacteria bacterium]MDX5492451.1 AzlC family ABC transporter permease [Alphaproteobacteria bacterium]
MAKAERKDWIEGARVMLPLLPGAVPFGMIAGVVASNAGLDALAGIGQSIVVFAGAAQLASTQLIADAAPVLVVILTGLVINLRFAMYSAAMAGHLSALPRGRRWLVAYLMTDQSYALSILRYAARPEMGLPAKFAFYMGGAIPMWAVWLAATAAGYFLGNRIPASWSLDFFVPLSFLALIVPSIADRANATAALTGGAVAVIAWSLPFNLGLFLAALAGIAAGYAVERLFPAQGEPK